MSFFDWGVNYSVGVKKIDEQHRRLIGMINRLHEGMQRGKGEDKLGAVIEESNTLGAVIEELIEYIAYHFATEEKLMHHHAYPEYASHKEAHTELGNRVRKFQRDFNDGKALFSEDLAQFLQKWLKHHIACTDKKLGYYLNRKGLT